MTSLDTDIIFCDALRSDTDLMEAIEGRLYGTAIPLPEEDAMNEPVPYIIVTFDGLTNDAQTKDDPYEGRYDRVQVGIELAAPTLDALGTLAQQVRRTIHAYFLENETAVSSYQLSGSAKQYDDLKPCHFMQLRYDCDVAVGPSE